MQVRSSESIPAICRFVRRRTDRFRQRFVVAPRSLTDSVLQALGLDGLVNVKEHWKNRRCITGAMSWRVDVCLRSRTDSRHREESVHLGRVLPRVARHIQTTDSSVVRVPAATLSSLCKLVLAARWKRRPAKAASPFSRRRYLDITVHKPRAMTRCQMYVRPQDRRYS
jgi:hypothetical protein